MVACYVRFVNIGDGRAGSDVLNAADDGAVAHDVDAGQVIGQGITVDGKAGSRQCYLGTQGGLLIGDNVDGRCGGSRGLGAKVNADVLHHETIGVSIADGMDSQVILASLVY